jgi:acetyl esterase/lipase
MTRYLFTLSLWLLVSAAETPDRTFTRTEDVIYGRAFGTALTLDVFRPEQPNGLGVIYVVSGGWYSAHEFITPKVAQPLLNHGYTVFAEAISPIYHVKAGVPPVFIIHGDADKLVPIQQAQVFLEKVKAAGGVGKLDTRIGAQHGWANWEADVGLFADWFDQHLKPDTKP